VDYLQAYYRRLNNSERLIPFQENTLHLLVIFINFILFHLDPSMQL
jgi:hypothetical protein